MDSNAGRFNPGWAVVTGASSGIGLVFARELARRGYSVLAVARRRDRLEALAADAAADGQRVEPFMADLATDQGLSSLVGRLRELAPVALLVNNAGVAAGGDFHAVPLTDQVGSVRLNIDAVVTLTYQVLPPMMRDRRGAIINVASVVAFQPFPHFAVYAASKAFVLSFTEAVAEEVRGSGVRILAICPGAARTEITVFAHNDGLLGTFPSLTPEEIVGTALGAVAAGRVVKIVGWANRVLVFMNRVMPRAAIRRVMGAVAKPPRTSPRQRG
jgi:short-subunit dehydrogenase